ncbi:MAG: hypothetical protein R6W90_15760 [Ignavibacteriaceae bacterium]
MHDHIIGLAWYNKTDWEEWKRISEDEIEDNYEDWLISAKAAKLSMENQGYTVEEVLISPADFSQWCRKNRKRRDSANRSMYVQMLRSMGQN